MKEIEKIGNWKKIDGEIYRYEAARNVFYEIVIGEGPVKITEETERRPDGKYTMREEVDVSKAIARLYVVGTYHFKKSPDPFFEREFSIEGTVNECLNRASELQSEYLYHN